MMLNTLPLILENASNLKNRRKVKIYTFLIRIPERYNKRLHS